MADYHQHALNLLQAGDWDGAHRMIQHYHDPLSCQIHGLLHRIEGDEGNAAYWYQRGGMSTPANSIEQEIERLLALN